MQMQSQKRFKVLTPIEAKKGGKTYWMKVGIGFPGKDAASFNLYIDAWPTQGKMLHVREMDEEDFQRGRREGPSSDPMPSGAPDSTDDLPF